MSFFLAGFEVELESMRRRREEGGVFFCRETGLVVALALGFLSTEGAFSKQRFCYNSNI